MKLKSIFLKKIDRNINGVIKAGQVDEKNIKEELEEYVVTSEMSEHFEQFFKAFSKVALKYTDKNAVWISGFFGSGKSHFLKMLSYLIGNITVDGKSAFHYFKDKGLKECTIEDIKNLEDTLSEVILFNISSKVNLSLKDDAILDVFNRVFNEKQGFCSSIPWVADFEKQLVEEKIYDTFKLEFKNISGKSWEKVRDSFYYYEKYIFKALALSANISEDTAKKICESAEKNFSLSVENFSRKVSSYCNSKGDSYRLVFLVDEIGQYIGDNSSLMLNLQTIVEDLGVKTEGRCWIIVTAQNDLNYFISTGKNDFSKIQGRFNTRIALSSSNVEDVIKMRILQKDHQSETCLRKFYNDNEIVINNILSFYNTSVINGYNDADKFIEVYPFVPYQFDFIQDIYKGLSLEGVTGRSLSKGERSLIETYQRIAIDAMNKEIGVLISFKEFYKGLEFYISEPIKLVIDEAEKNENLSEFCNDVLKVLFLIKFIDGFESNIENISTLMVSHINEDKNKLTSMVKEALDKLEVEGLIEKSGDIYRFLSKEEQLVNEKILGIAITKDDINNKIGEIIFEDIYGESKFNYSSRYKFSFNKSVNNKKIVSKNEIGIKVVTSDFEICGDVSSELKRLSALNKEMILDITGGNSCIEDTERLLQIDTYLKEVSYNEPSQWEEVIYNRKKNERAKLLSRIRFLLNEELRKASIYISGSYLEINEKDISKRINEGLRTLIDLEYFKLNYIKEFIDETNDLINIVDGCEYDNKLAVEEIKILVDISKGESGKGISLKNIFNRFRRLPYGWRKIDIQAVVIKLLKNKEIKLILNGKIVESDNLVKYISTNDYWDELILKPKERLNPKHRIAVEELAYDLFNINNLSKDSDEAMREFRSGCLDELKQINEMLDNYFINSYPGKSILNNAKMILEKIININNTTEFFHEIYNEEDEILECFDYIEELKGFFFKRVDLKNNIFEKSNQRIIFDEGLILIENHENNRGLIDNIQISNIINEANSIIKSESPFKEIPRLSILINKYNSIIGELIEKEKYKIKANIDEVYNKLMELNLLKSFKDNVENEYTDLIKRLDLANDFMKLAGIEKLAEKSKINWIYNSCNEAIINPIKDESLSNKFNANLQTEEDVDRFIGELSNILKMQLKK